MSALCYFYHSQVFSIKLFYNLLSPFIVYFPFFSLTAVKVRRLHSPLVFD